MLSLPQRLAGFGNERGYPEAFGVAHFYYLLHVVVCCVIKVGRDFQSTQ
jgi:hypothetical protein